MGAGGNVDLGKENMRPKKNQLDIMCGLGFDHDEKSHVYELG